MSKSTALEPGLRMDEQGFDEADRLRYLVAEARQALEKVGLGAFDVGTVR